MHATIVAAGTTHSAEPLVDGVDKHRCCVAAAALMQNKHTGIITPTVHSQASNQHT